MADEHPSKGDFEPVHTVLEGVPFVTISLARYKELLAASTISPPLVSEARAKLRASTALRRPPLPSTIEQDPEVAAFLRERFQRAATLRAAFDACHAKFGADRTPSISRIGRMRSKVRAGA